MVIEEIMFLSSSSHFTMLSGCLIVVYVSFNSPYVYGNICGFSS